MRLSLHKHIAALLTAALVTSNSIKAFKHLIYLAVPLILQMNPEFHHHWV